jgi:hypothetical protein
MSAVKKQEPQPEPQPSLAQRFLAAHKEMIALGDQLINEHVDYLRECYPDLPRPTLEMDLYKHRACTCAVALEVASKVS